MLRFGQELFCPLLDQGQIDGRAGITWLEIAQCLEERLLVVQQDYAFLLGIHGVLHGLITPKDVLEAITGELLQSTSPGQVWATLRTDQTWLLDGLMPIQELKSRLEIDELPMEDKRVYNTLAGLVMAVLGRLPSVGDTAKCGAWQFEVQTLDERRINSVIARRKSLPKT